MENARLSAPSAPSLTGRYLTAVQAAQLAGRTRQCISRWCRKHGLGERLGHEWMVDRERLTAFLRARAGGDHAGA
jgi:hypothetical protein